MGVRGVGATTAEGRGLRLVGQSDLGGFGDAMQLQAVDGVLYVGHVGTSGMGTSILDVSDPSRPRLVRQWPAPAGTHTHKVQVAEGLLLVNYERFRGASVWSGGMAVYSLEDPLNPVPVGVFRSGGAGVHRMVWTGGPLAYVSATPEGFTDRILLVVDLSDPERPVEVGRWWWPGQWVGGGERPTWPEGKRYAAHHALLDGPRAYAGYGDAGMVVLDVSDPTAPAFVGSLSWSPGGDTHTCLPLPSRGLVVVTDESVRERCQEEPHLVRVVQVSGDSLRVLATCPVPRGDFCRRGLRFGPHNLHENRPGSYRSETLVFATYFNAGLRVYDLGEPADPREVASWVPEPPLGQAAPQVNDVFVDSDRTVYVSDRIHGGVYVLEPEDELATKMEEARSG